MKLKNALASIASALTLSVTAAQVSPAVALDVMPMKDAARKEFSACEIKHSRPANSRFIKSNLKLSSNGGSKNYYADVFLDKGTNPRFKGYTYQVKESAKGSVIGFFRVEYRRAAPGYASLNSLWDPYFSGCGPRNVKQDYPVINYQFYDTTIGIKLTGYRSPVFLGQVSNPNPMGLFSAINQLDGPDWGS